MTLLLLLLPFLGLGQVQIGQDIDGLSNSDRFGESISVSSDGSVVAIGGVGNNSGGNSNTGYVSIYENIGGVWTQIGSDINGVELNDRFGISVSLSSDGSIVAIGASRNDGNGEDSGLVQIYQNVDNIWIQMGQDIYGSFQLVNGQEIGERFGVGLNLSSDGSTLAIGSLFGNFLTGNVRIYQFQTGTWIQVGNDINGGSQEDNFGISVSLSSDGSIVAIGAHFNDENGNNSGKVKVYENINGIWTQLGLDINGEAENDNLGFSVSLSSDGSVVAVGAMYSNNFIGKVRVYKYESDSWTKLGQDINGEAINDFFGWSVSISSDGLIVVVGAPGNDEFGTNSGRVNIFNFINTDWIQIGNDIDGLAATEGVGESVSISSDGNIIAFGAIGANMTGQARVYDLSALLSVNNLLNIDFSIYPNPTKNQFTIQLDPSVELQKVMIYNILGQAVLISEEKTINTSKLSSGSYIVEIITNKGKSSKQLIIE